MLSHEQKTSSWARLGAGLADSAAPWALLAFGRVHFSEVSDTGSLGHFVDLDEIQRPVWSEPPKPVLSHEQKTPSQERLHAGLADFRRPGCFPLVSKSAFSKFQT